jgi:serine O-acetyltransferase
MWEDPEPERPLPLLASLWKDALARLDPDKWPTTVKGKVELALGCLASSGYRCSLNYRLAHTARARLGMPGKLVSGALFWWNRHFYGCAIAPTARLHGGLCFPHPFGISIGPGAVVGPETWIFQNVIIVGSPTKKTGMPVVGRNAALFAGAVITGPVRLGDHCMVGANAVVAKNLEPGTFYTVAEGRESSLALLGLLPRHVVERLYPDDEDGAAGGPVPHSPTES